MKEFAGRIAVVTGGGSGMGRELVRQLVAEACNVSICDLAAEGMAETVRLCEAAGLPQGLRVTTHIADVSDFAQMERFRAEVADRPATDRIHLLFNNAGIGGGSLIVNSREEWERTFNVCWGSVYNGTRAFLPLLLKGAFTPRRSRTAATSACTSRLKEATRLPWHDERGAGCRTRLPAAGRAPQRAARRQ